MELNLDFAENTFIQFLKNIFREQLKSWFHRKILSVIAYNVDCIFPYSRCGKMKSLVSTAAQCGNYGNSLSRIFVKNFVKVTVLLSKLLKSWFDEIFLWWERISRFSTLCATQILREISFGRCFHVKFELQLQFPHCTVTAFFKVRIFARLFYDGFYSHPIFFVKKGQKLISTWIGFSLSSFYLWSMRQ